MTAPKKKVVLVVDDREQLRKILAHHLITAGYSAIEAENGTIALDLAKGEKVDLVILDVMMPKVDGFTVLEKLKENEKTARLPVIICTAKGYQDDVVHAAKLGAKGYIVKPFTKSVVLEKVMAIIGEPPPEKIELPLAKADKKPKPADQTEVPPAAANPEAPPHKRAVENR